MKYSDDTTAEIRSEFLQVLRSRRTAEGRLSLSTLCVFLLFVSVWLSAAEIGSEFLQVLRSRRTAEGRLSLSTLFPLSVVPVQPVPDPLFEETRKPTYSQAMDSCPKKEIPKFRDLLQEENFYLTTEAGEQGRLPVLLVKLKENTPEKRPAVVFLHSTHKNKEWLRPLLEVCGGSRCLGTNQCSIGALKGSLTKYQELDPCSSIIMEKGRYNAFHF
ncbi:hypothetical protein C2S53_019090 [Perilla frutescens var. hirtella]|uniref:Uncharacterized protein n=1 Tax=Perilla frutescens var. hirtella TaxID=608512 RepID=A0AAD4PCC6_PERFH|nr:hypothetical protein C2S53_019090 [Perilla frutescens var. hirtella]